MDRTALRTLHIARRKTVPATNRIPIEKQLARRLWNAAPVRKARHLSIYFAVNGEISLDAFIDTAAQRNVRLYAPALSGKSLRFSALHAGMTFRTNRYGIPEPNGGPYIDARSLDVVLTPLVAFDETGTRLGMGGGFYDRCFHFLSQRKLWCKPKLIGVGFEQQRVSHIDSEVWDVKLWAAITEKKRYFF